MTATPRLARLLMIVLAVPLFLAGMGMGMGTVHAASTLTRLPLPYTPTISGAAGQASVTVTLPAGAAPVRFVGEVRSSYVDEGLIVITLNGRRVAEVPARTGGVVSAPLTGADVENGIVVVRMYADLDPRTDCFVDTTSVASLANAAISYAHEVDAPKTIGRFLSDGVQDLTVQVGTDASAAEQQAALDAVAALVKRYRPPAQVRLVTSDVEPRGDFLNRVVVVRERAATEQESSTAGTLTVTPEGYLLVSGPSSGLSSAAISLADPALRLVGAATLAQVSGTADWSPATRTTSLEALGTAPISLSGVGRVEAVVGIGQPAFGGSLSALSLDMVGVVTDLPVGATGRIDFLWNNVLVESRDMTDETAVDVPIGISADQLRRDNALTIQLSYVPPSGSCSPPPLPARLDIDTRLSTVTPTYGDSLPAGFDRFPQVLGPSIPVVLGSAAAPARALQQAGDLVAGLSAATPEQLTTTILSLEQFLADEVAGIIVAAPGSLTQELQAPYQVGTVLKVSDGSARFTADLKGPLALAQAFDDGTRDLVLLGPLPSSADDPASAPALTLTDAFAEQVATEPLRWTVLTGRVMVLGASGQLEAVAIPEASTAVVSPVSLLFIGLISTFTIIAALIVWSLNKPKEPAPPVPGTSITE